MPRIYSSEQARAAVLTLWAKRGCIIQPRPCYHCGVLFKPRANKTQFCSRLCAYKAQKCYLSEYNEKQKTGAIRRVGIKKWKKAFIGMIFQPKGCMDCGLVFDTLYPRLRPRCDECRLRSRLANHGGGPRRRCKKFDVPYEAINPLTVFNRDNWLCCLCKQSINPNLLGRQHDIMAPEMEHDWPLSVKIGELKSPGHVMANVFAAHRICNQKKGERVSLNDTKRLVEKFYSAHHIVSFNPTKPNRNPNWYERTCQRCGGLFSSRSNTAKWCSTYCLRHKRTKDRALLCPRCNTPFTTNRFYQVYCSEACGRRARKVETRHKTRLTHTAF